MVNQNTNVVVDRSPAPRRDIDPAAATRVPTRAFLTSTTCAAWLLSLLPAAAQSLEQQVEEEWRRHDRQRLAQIFEPGVLRLVEEQVDWPGVTTEQGRPCPRTNAPQLDGRLADPCWQQAMKITPTADGDPTLLLCRDDQQIYVGLSLPAASMGRFRGHFTARDAAGAVDGVKDGTYGFHTWRMPHPWWQVDLGSVRPIERLVVYNRQDYAPGLHNADHLIIRTSDDGLRWAQVYDNGGRHFGGASSGKPLEVVFPANEVRARYVRLELNRETPIFFHLDEVEIYGPENSDQNLALNRPAQQSSLSRWSRGGERGSDLFTLGELKFTFASDDAQRIAIDNDVLPAERAVVFTNARQTTAEMTLPLQRFSSQGSIELLPRHGSSIALDVRRDWRLAWSSEPLGYGKNRLQVTLEACGPLEPPVDLTVEAVALTPQRFERQVVYQDILHEPATMEVDCAVAAEGPVAILVTGRQGDITSREGKAFYVLPVVEPLDRAERLLAEFGNPLPAQLRDLRGRLDELVDREASTGPDLASRARLCRAARWLARKVALSNPLLDFDRLLLVKRFTQQSYPDVCLNHMPWCSRPGGDLCVVSPPRPDGEVRSLIDGQLGPGHVHGMDLWYDADRVVFGYARAASDQPPTGWLDRRTSFELRRSVEPTHLYEIGIEGTHLRQLTEGEWSDLDPTYLPSGEVAFVSERCGYSLQCNELDKDETSCNLYTVDLDRNVRRLTVSKDGDYLPHTLDNGLIAYTRWEYQERLWANIQSIWIVRPDGTGADALFKQHFNDPWALEDVRSIPGSNKLVAVATGHHTLACGPVVVVDPAMGINTARGIRIVTPGVLPPEGGMAGVPVRQGGVLGAGGYYQTPWPLSEKHFLVSYTYGDTQDEKGYAVYLIDVFGTRELIYRDPEISCSLPIPLRPRQKPPVLGRVADTRPPQATCLVTDVYEGLEGVERGSIRYLRIASRLPWPYNNQHGGLRFEPDVKRVMVNWTPARVIGIVPVEPDGSASFFVPVDVPVYFQALDANMMEVRRMRSFINFQPGESRGCTGCHETRAAAPPHVGHQGSLLAFKREPSHPIPPSWGTRAMSFLRDVQPVFDRHCTQCHEGLKPAGGIDLSGGLTASHNRAWETINQHQLIARSDVGEDARITPPFAFGSHRSKLIQALSDTNHASAVRLEPDDWQRLVTWIDLNGPYHANFLNKRPDQPAYNLATDADLSNRLKSIHHRRCRSCHPAEVVSRTDWIDLADPARSRFLTAPLAVDFGGKGNCPQSTYRTTSDPDYQALLGAVRDAVRRVRQQPRRDLVFSE